MKQNFLFILGGLNLGGVETYIVRLSKELNKKNINVKILLLHDSFNKELINEVEKYANVYFFKNLVNFNISNKIIKKIIFFFSLDRKKTLLSLGKIDVIHSTSSETISLANALLNFYPNAKITSGVYHSKEYIWNSNFYFRRIEKDLFTHFSESNILSCNEFSISLLKEHYGLKEEIPLIPIGIKSLNCIYYNVNSKKIVSIGRLVKFKTYNEHIIRILDKLSDELNMNLEYHIYGYGNNEKYLKKISKDVKSKVFFHGVLDYSKFSEVLEDAILFVGSGTAIIEASSLGIPSIIGIESNLKSQTYGFFSDLKSYSYNEDNLNIEKYTYFKVIKNFFLNSKKRQYSNFHKEKSKEFLIENTSEHFIKYSLESKNALPFKYNIFRYNLSYLIWHILNKIGLNNELKRRFLDV